MIGACVGLSVGKDVGDAATGADVVVVVAVGKAVIGADAGDAELAVGKALIGACVGFAVTETIGDDVVIGACVGLSVGEDVCDSVLFFIDVGFNVFFFVGNEFGTLFNIDSTVGVVVVLFDWVKVGFGVFTEFFRGIVGTAVGIVVLTVVGCVLDIDALVKVAAFEGAYVFVSFLASKVGASAVGSSVLKDSGGDECIVGDIVDGKVVGGEAKVGSVVKAKIFV